jgi:hypothetical protein
MKRQQKKINEMLQKNKKNKFTDNKEIDDIIENFSFGIPGTPDIVSEACLWRSETKCKKFKGTEIYDLGTCETKWYKYDCTETRTKGIPGVTINFPDVPSMDSIFDNIKDSINRDLIVPIQNTFNSILDAAKKGVQDLIDSITREFQEIIDKITDGFNDAINKINEWFKNLAEQMDNIFGQMTDFFNKIGKSFTQMGKGLGDIFTGLFVDGPQGLGEGLSKGFTDIGVLLFWAGEYFFSNMKCGVHFIQNLNICFSYYVLDTIRYILYSPVSIVKWFVIEAGGHDLTDFENQVWSYIYDIDMMTGIHAFKYSKDINNRCYNCKRLKVLALKNKSEQINNDFVQNLPQLLNKGSDRMKKGGDEFLAAF